MGTSEFDSFERTELGLSAHQFKFCEFSPHGLYQIHVVLKHIQSDVQRLFIWRLNHINAAKLYWFIRDEIDYRDIDVVIGSQTKKATLQRNHVSMTFKFDDPNMNLMISNGWMLQYLRDFDKWNRTTTSSAVRSDALHQSGPVVHSKIETNAIPVDQLAKSNEDDIAVGKLNDTILDTPTDDWEQAARNRRDEMLKGTFS